MKLFFLMLGIIFPGFQNSSSFYGIPFNSGNGTILNTSAYQGKKVVIAIVSGDAAGLNMVHYLDSVQHANTGLQVIVVPTSDFGGSVNRRDLEHLAKNINIVITQPLKVKKSNGIQQHPLFSWLTKSSENQHFDKDAEGEGQLFIVSGAGTLHSVLPKNTPKTVISRVINQPFSE